MESTTSISITLDAVQDGLLLHIDARREGTLFEVADAHEHHEAPYQLLEGSYYDYTFSDDRFRFKNDLHQIVQPHSRNKHTGTLAPNIYVGTLSLDIYKNDENCQPSNEANQPSGKLELEVQSVKSGYRDDYRDMLELITEKCTDLLLQANAPTAHHFEVDYAKDSETLYQRFAFVKSIVDSEEFVEAIHRIVTNPVTQWTEIAETKDVRQARRFSNSTVKELMKGSRRSKLPKEHHLRSYGFKSLPERITTIRKSDSVDTPENRFVKHALETFLKFCMDVNQRTETGSQLYRESDLLIKSLEARLHHDLFKEISRPQTLKINSPVLQRKEGYRELLRVWLMFDLAAKLIWEGGNDVYQGGKKDIATLYEYWLFFKLLDLLQGLFQIAPKELESLIEETSNGLNLKLKQGRFTALEGIYNSPKRKLRVQFSYNRTFSGKKEHPAAGSWTTTLRPDYTLSLWPDGITEAQAEEEELVVHIHFDAKYKIVNTLPRILEGEAEESESDLDLEKSDNRKGIYKNADLLKMHAYKDAIRRTGGAYVLYPGDTPVERKGFHEIIPGLGAFPVKPSKTDTGLADLKAFLIAVIDQLMNRASQREKLAFRIFDIHKKPPTEEDEIKEILPEAYGPKRDQLPSEISVLVGYYREVDYKWIVSRKLYSFKMNTGSGSMVLDAATVAARYLLLYTAREERTAELWRIVSQGPMLYSRADLLALGFKNPDGGHYLVVEIERVQEPEFKERVWVPRDLPGYLDNATTEEPFVVNLGELMKHSSSN